MFATLEGQPAAAVPADVSLRPVLRTLGAADESALVKLHRDCPLSVEGGLALERSPSFFSWPRAVLGSFTYAGAFVNGVLEASLAAGTMRVATSSASANALLLFDARTRTSSRGRGLTALLAFRLIAERASECELAIVARRLDNRVAARCTRLGSPVTGTVPLVRPLSVLTLSPDALTLQGVREGTEADLGAPSLLGRPALDLQGLPNRVFRGPGGAAALVADTATVRSRSNRQGASAVDVRALTFDEPLEAAALLHSIGALLGRPVRVALSPQQPLARLLHASAVVRVECELRLVLRETRLVDFDNPTTPFVLDASLL